MICKLNKLFIFIIVFLFFGFKNDNSSQKKFFDIFSPDNLNVDGNSHDVTKPKDIIQDFTVYGIISYKNVKKVIIKPKKISSFTKKQLNKRGYIVLKPGDKFKGFELVDIKDDIAIFKNKDKVVRLSVFNEEKKDRAPQKISASGPTIVGSPPQASSIKKTKTYKKINSKTKKTNSNLTNSKKKKLTKSFLELLKKAKKNQNNSSNKTTKPQNPFLKLFNRK